MISALTGELIRVAEDRVYVRVGPILCEVLVAAFDVRALQNAVGEEMTFHTIFYLEGDAGGGNIEPRLVGFLRPEDKSFFQLFITVKGIGPRKALRALALPVGEIARAIESRDTRLLVELPQIGKRMAELIVAELSGKVTAYAAAIDASRPATVALGRARQGDEEDAIQTLMALGERRIDAELLLDRARQGNPALKSTDAFVREMLRLRAPRG
jgi:Holliday junction DNA helicase RuvA